MTQLPSRLELIKKTFFFCTKAPYARVPLSKPQYLAFVGWPLLPPTSELHILEKKKTNPKLQEVFCLSSLSHCPLASSPHSFSYRVCLSFLMSSLVASPLWKFSKTCPTSQSCCSAPCYPLCCPACAGHGGRKRGSLLTHGLQQ